MTSSLNMRWPLMLFRPRCIANALLRFPITILSHRAKVWIGMRCITKPFWSEAGMKANPSANSTRPRLGSGTEFKVHAVSKQAILALVGAGWDNPCHRKPGRGDLSRRHLPADFGRRCL
jgi:hypothetical protein